MVDGRLSLGAAGLGSDAGLEDVFWGVGSAIVGVGLVWTVSGGIEEVAC